MARNAVRITNISAPVEVPPGTQFPIEVSVRATKDVFPIDPDFCTLPFDQSAVGTTVEVIIDGAVQDSMTMCVGDNVDENFNFRFRSPSDENPLNVRVVARGRTSENIFASRNFEIDVLGEATPPVNGGNGGNGDDSFNITEFIIQNPGKSLVLGVGGAFVLDRIVSEAI